MSGRLGSVRKAIPGKKAIGLSAALATLIPAPVQAQDEHPRSYYPTLTRADITQCRAQFAALQADVVEHFRQSAASYAPGGESYKTNPAGYADGNNVRVYTAAKNEFAAKDPLTFYVEGLMGDGEGVGNLDSVNKYWDEETASNRLSQTPESQPANWLRYSLARPQIEAPAEKCVAKVWMKKFNAMHAPKASTGGSNVPPLRPTVVSEAHNPANEASNCLEPIDASNYKARGVSSTMGAVFRNRCAYPVEAHWCIGADRCAKGYDNLATMPASADRAISYDPPSDGSKAMIRWGACRLGFAARPDLAGTLKYSCK